MAYKGIIFDLDGTLIDSMADIAAATNRTMAKHGFAEHPVESFRHFIGDGVRKLILRALPESERSNEQVISSCLSCYADDYRTTWNVKTSLFPGIADAIEQLSAKGLKLAVLSNKPDEFTQACVLHYLKQWRFDTVMGASTRFPHKPDPTSAIHIARSWGIEPAEVVYVGDMQVDMQTARNAGMLAVGATWGLRTREELIKAGAQRTVDRPEELVRILDS